MNLLEAVFLGALQGLAEFLPVSSSGHLALAAAFMDLGEVPFLFDILLHVATLAAVCIFFRKKIVSLILVLARFLSRRPREGDEDGMRMIGALLAGTAVTALIGFAIKDVAKNLPPVVISVLLVFTGVLLLVSSRFKMSGRTGSPGVLQGLIVGAAQGLGVLPGISRSGSTIAASLLSGVDRRIAGEFSFLLSIPAILGAFILELKDADTLGNTVPAYVLTAGMLAAFVVGYLSLRFLISLINRGKLGWFATYLIPAGITLAIWFGVH